MVRAVMFRSGPSDGHRAQVGDQFEFYAEFRFTSLAATIN